MIHIDPADVAAMARDLRRIESLLEESPVPDREWPRVLAVFDRDRLAPLLGISPSSAVRYARHWQKLQQFRGGAMFSERFRAARLLRA